MLQLREPLMNKFLLSFTIIIIVASCKSNSGTEALQNTIDSVLKVNDSLRRELNTSATPISNISDTAAVSRSESVNHTSNNRHHIVSEALRSKPNLIPLDAVLGGTMYFSDIKVISDDLVLADYEDGHIMGQTLFEYKIAGNGEVTFKAIRSREY